MNTSAKDTLIGKLDRFIRKYYTDRLIKGCIYGIALWISFFLIISFMEYFGYFSMTVRTGLFYAYIVVSLIIFYVLILTPIFRIYKIGKTLSYADAAHIIGKYFPEVSDKLLNFLQLREMSSDLESDLLLASITQKTNALSRVPFVRAINFSRNRKYIRWAIIPVVILIGILFVAPSLITHPAKRIINHSTYYEKPAPFHFVLLNQELSAIRNSDYTIKVRTEGEAIPEMIHVKTNGKLYRMKAEKKGVFEYTFRNLQQDQIFVFEAIDVSSRDYQLRVLPNPVLIDFQAKVQYPSYTKKTEEIFSNVGDLMLPKGSVVTWFFQTRDAEKLRIITDSLTKKELTVNPNGRATYEQRINASSRYVVCPGNTYVSDGDSLLFSVTIIEDAFPQIAVLEQLVDSVIADKTFFRGQIKDDYGFSALKFHLYRTHSEKSSDTIWKEVDIPIRHNELSQEFYYDYSLTSEQMQLGESISYYFEVWDNDQINGAKSARSQLFQIDLPTQKELEEKIEKTNADLKDEAQKLLLSAKEIQKEINETIKKLLDKKELNWQDKVQIESLLKQQEMFKAQIEQIQEQIKQNNRQEERYKDLDPELVEKQKQLEKLFEELMNEETKKLLDELKELANKLDKDKIKETLDKLKMKNEDVEKQLDRNMELFKHLELEKKMTDVMKKTEELAQEQKELAKQTEQKESVAEDLQKKQEEINQKFSEIRDQLSDIEKKNSELERPNAFKRPQEREEKISKSQKEATQQLERDQPESAAQQQQDAAEELEKLAEDLSDAMDDMEQDSLAEDAHEIRQLLKNLVKLSFEQEDLLLTLQATKLSDPRYQEIINRQNRLKINTKSVEDSLYAISKRQPMVGPMVNRELSDIKMHIERAIERLLFFNQAIYQGYSQNKDAVTSQQYAMTSFNNLALLLAESLKNMQDKMDSKSKGGKSNKSCSNPSSGSGQGKKKSSSKGMKELQEQLSKQLEQMKKQMEQKGKDGKDGKQGRQHKIGEGSEMNEGLARMAAQQAAIRKMLQEYAEHLKQGQGKGSKGLDQLLREMEQNEEDIVNKTITAETMLRQQQILTRLLEHEKAEQEQEYEEQRESRVGKDFPRSDTSSVLNYKKLKTRELELLRPQVPAFSPYYKRKVSDYFYTFDD